MKTKIILGSVIMSSVAQLQAASFVHHSMYNKVSFSQGMGTDKKSAEDDARSAVPAGYKDDPANSPAIDCAGGKGVTFDSKLNICPDKSKVVYTLPVVKK